MSDFVLPELDCVRVLPIELSNQIAAGEVVERPASALRELVENALDAGATRIDVEIEEGGSRLIRVVDNGRGMSPGDAERSIQRHATSKILTREDLFRIASLGFRGEALPSIASVSRFELLTRQATTLTATRVYVEGGSLKLVEPSSAPVGTSVTVRDLFYNTPARQKFLKTKATEQRACLAVMQRLATPRPNVSFSLTANGRSLLKLPAVDEIWTRIESIVGYDDAKNFFPADPVEFEGTETWGFIAGPSHDGRTAESVQIFVNGRAIRDRALIQAVKIGYDTLVDRGRFPSVFLFVNVPTDAIDVNVHPAKTEVRFQNPQAVYRSIRRCVRSALTHSPWLPSVDDSGQGAGDSPAHHHGESFSLQTRDAPIENERLSLWTGPTRTYALQRSDAAGETPVFSGSGRSEMPPSRVDGGLRAAWRTEPTGGDPSAVPEEGWFQSLHYIGPLHRLYLLFSDTRGLVIVDQHASHERISFERLRETWRTRQLATQPNLIPHVFSLPPIKAMALEENLAFFTRLGFEIEPFGGEDFALRATPDWFDVKKFNGVLSDALDDLIEEGYTTRVDESIEAILSRMACHGSVRAGDALSPGEVHALMAQLDACDFGANCPHGRPVWFRMTLEELETRFERR